MPRHHHGDGDEALPVGGLAADVANLNRLLDTLERTTDPLGKAPYLGEIAADLNSARVFLDDLRTWPVPGAPASLTPKPPRPPVATQEGVPFNDYVTRMLGDIAAVRWLCDTLEHVAGELPNGDTATTLLRVNLARSRAFMDALEVMPSTIRVATPEEVARAAQGAVGGVS